MQNAFSLSCQTERAASSAISDAPSGSAAPGRCSLPRPASPSSNQACPFFVVLDARRAGLSERGDVDWRDELMVFLAHPRTPRRLQILHPLERIRDFGR